MNNLRTEMKNIWRLEKLTKADTILDRNLKNQPIKKLLN